MHPAYLLQRQGPVPNNALQTHTDTLCAESGASPACCPDGAALNYGSGVVRQQPGLAAALC